MKHVYFESTNGDKHCINPSHVVEVRTGVMYKFPIKGSGDDACLEESATGEGKMVEATVITLDNQDGRGIWVYDSFEEVCKKIFEE